jgi:hypothetical protein
MSAVFPSDSAARTSAPSDRAPKRIATGVRVSGAIGKQIPNPNPAIKRKCRERLFGVVLSAVGSNRYRIRLDNGCIVEAASAVLKVHGSSNSLPPGAVGQQDLNQESTEIHDRDDSEPLPLGNDEEEEQGGLEEEAPGRAEERPVGNLEEEPLEPINTYEGRKQQAISKIKAMEGKEVTVGRGKGRAREEVTWTVIPESHPDGYDLQDDSSPSIVSRRLGLREIDAIMRKAGFDVLLAFIFIFISFKDWEEKLDKMNEAVQLENEKVAGGKKVPLFSAEEFLKGFGILIAAAGYNCKGAELWSKEPEGDIWFGNDVSTWPNIIPAPNFSRFMSLNRFNQWRKFITFINKDPTLMHDGKQDPWWEFSGAVDEFNQHRLRCILHSLRLIEDESMSAWVPRTTPTGGLPNISHIDRKPEPLGKPTC